ncbi:hypothetical protein ASC78_00630 [Variovorax sp. Root318D1]|nr:hypothetical protein ASC78_00630 [Variovorax sp. Root318D1]
MGPFSDTRIEVQARQNVLAVLEAAGSGPQDVLKVTAYIVDVGNWPALNKIYAEVMRQAPAGARRGAGAGAALRLSHRN